MERARKVAVPGTYQSNIGSLQCDATTVAATLCTPATALLPPPLGTGNCAGATWSLVGGNHQGAWNVGLATTAAGVASTTVTGCQAFFVVIDFNPSAPGANLDQRVIVTERASGSTASLAITLAATTGTVCSTESNLVCQ